MKLKLITTFLLLTLIFGVQSQAQTILWSENFNSGTTSSQMTLNTTDVVGGSASIGNNGIHLFYIGNGYTGGTVNVINPCPKFPILSTPVDLESFDTPTQPSGIAGNPTSNYLHIDSKLAYDNGLTNTHYWASSGLCLDPQANFAKMNSDINTTTYSTVTIKFWTIMGGLSNTIYGQVFYSTDGGNTWTELTTSSTRLVNILDWTQKSLTSPQLAGKATLRFGFRWYNGSVASGTPQDPGFGIDDIEIEGVSGGTSNTITTGTINGSPFCPNASVSVPFTSTGTFNGGNAFDVYLSDANGTFPGTKIGSGSSSPINAIIPPAATAGSGYRMRVVASNPATTGSDNGTNLTISAVGVAGVISASKDTICETTPAILTVTGSSGSIQWQSSTSPSGPFTDVNLATNTIFTDLPTTTTYYKVKAGSGSCSAVSPTAYVIVVRPSPTASFTFTKAGKKVTFTNTSTGASTYEWNFGDGQTSNVVSPSHTYSKDSTWRVCLGATNGSNCSFTICVDVFVAIEKIDKKGQWEIFPDPVADNIFIRAKQGSLDIETIEIFDLIGRSVAAENFMKNQQNTLQMDVSGLPKGMYFLKIKTADSNYVQSIIKQ